jgi:hypothetical protein
VSCIPSMTPIPSLTGPPILLLLSNLQAERWGKTEGWDKTVLHTSW